MKSKDILQKQIKDKRLVSSYIFYGSDEELIYQVARNFASDLGISSFDIVEIAPEIGEEKSKNEIKIKVVKELVRQINLTPGHGKKKLAIIRESDKLNLEAANTLLKTLEEPPASSLIILLSRDLKLLPTIISRCQIIRFNDKAQAIEENIVNNLLGAEKKNLRTAFVAAEKLSRSKNLEDDFETTLEYLRTKLLKDLSQSTVKKIKAVLKAKINLRVTTNKKLVLENLALELIK